ncbi:MAG: pitrilysin family protein [Ignavibacteriales bacterium]|nr:pitrilysin family protein [Ignavibacteriales bacterium]
MTKLIIRALPLLLLGIGSIAMADSIFPYRYQKEILPNGLTVIMIPMESPGLVAYYSVVRTGSRDEVEPGKSGFAHFFEHMMFRGTKKYPGSVYDSVITSIGANANAYTTDDYTAYHLELATEDLEKVIEMESDRFQNLSYEQREFQTEAGAVYGEYRKGITSPFSVLNEKMQNLAFDVHTYKHTTIGFEADIKAMPEAYDYSKSFFHRFYRPENVVLLIVGDIDQQKTLSLVKQYYGGWEKGYVLPAITPEPPQRGERTADIDYPGRTLPILDIAYKGDAYDPGNRLFVASTVLSDLAFGETSDIYKKLVVNEQRVQMLSASIPVNRDVPLFEIYSMVKKVDDVAAVRDEIFAVLEQFKKVPVDAKKLNDLKRRNKYSFLMHLSTPDHVAGGLARFAALSGSIETVNGFYAALDNVTAEDVMKAAQKYFVPDSRSVVVLKGAK